MKIDLEINNITKSPIADEFFIDVAEKTFVELGYSFLQDKKVEISLALVTKAEIRKLNRRYRKHDSITDVLSFPEYKNRQSIKKSILKNSKEKLFLGELVLCYDDIKEYANKEEARLEKELANVVSHGILHLLGFKHGEKMFILQRKVIKETSES